MTRERIKGLGGCEEGDIISFGEESVKYEILSLYEEYPDDPIQWIWRAVLVELREPHEYPDGFEGPIYDSRKSYIMRFTDPDYPSVIIHD